MSFWGELSGAVTGAISTGVATWEKKELAELGLYQPTVMPNDGTTGAAAGLPDQTAVYKSQDVGPVPAPGSGRVEVLGLQLDKDALILTGLVLAGLWAAGKLG